MSASESSSQSASAGGPRTRRPWAPAEDAVLQALVGHYGDARGSDGAWKEISAAIVNRTAKAGPLNDCRKRWFHSLDPSLRKGRWTAEEDETLLAAYSRLGPVWHDIAALIPGRKDDQCSKRYNEILNPLARNRLTDWTAREDDLLRQGVHALGHRWSAISSRIPGRPPLTCRNRWRALSRAVSARHINEQTTATAATTTSSQSPTDLFGELDDRGQEQEQVGHDLLDPALYDTPFWAGAETQSTTDPSGSLSGHLSLLLSGMEAETSPEQASYAAPRPSLLHNHTAHPSWLGPSTFPSDSASLPDVSDCFSAGPQPDTARAIHQVVHVHHHYHYYIAKQPDNLLQLYPVGAEPRREERPEAP